MNAGAPWFGAWPPGVSFRIRSGEKIGFANGLSGHAETRMIYSVLIAICLSTTPVDKCDRASAIDWIPGPRSEQADGMFVSLSACQMMGMRYLAQTRLMDKNTYAKIFCQPPRQPVHS